MQVAEILARRRHPKGKSFRVRSANSFIFEMEYDEASDAWLIEPL